MPVGPDRSGASTAGEDLASRKNLLLLIQLRWLAVAGQVVTITVVAFAFEVDLPLMPMAGVLLALVALNLASLVQVWRRTRIRQAELFGALVFDVAALTVQLYLSGGGTNPFTFLFLLQVTLGAVLLETRAAFALVGLIGLCFTHITVIYRPLDLPARFSQSLLNLHMDGLLICFVLNAVLVVVFVTRINRNVRERDARLAGLREQAAEEAHIVRMGLLASGAAHELGTPLSTLSVILGDWRRMPALMADPELAQEIDAMQAQVQRCKAIVSGTLLSAGEARSESAAATTLQSFLDALVADWRALRPSADLAYENATEGTQRIVADSALRQAIVNVLDNAFEASPAGILFRAEQQGDLLQLSVSDAGTGFPETMLTHIGKPYQSTKGGTARGIGLFLVANVVRKLGGQVEVRNKREGGAVVTIALPLSALALGRSPADG
jgi:two-component system sensor histidine kinase RegB